jgi:predicted transcriptional regulator
MMQKTSKKSLKLGPDPTAGESGKGKPTTVRLGDDLTEKIRAMANERGMTFSAVIRVAAETYLEREDFGVALGEVEASIASTLNASRRDTAKVAEDVQLLVAVLDQFIRFSMMVAPEVIDKEGAVALGNRRHSGFIAELHKAFHTRSKKAVLTRTLEDIGIEEAGERE